MTSNNNSKINSLKDRWTTTQMIVKPFWQLASWYGMRSLGSALQRGYPAAYRDTMTHFTTDENVVALTIDDGICRTSASADNSMAKEVQELLQKYQAHATFFVCTDYIKGQEEEVQSLLQNGNELGNHLQKDVSFYYSRLSPEEFRAVLSETNQVLDALEDNGGGNGNNQEENTKIRWFRAPQGVLTSSMKQVIDEQQENIDMKHVLGDCYCDDWKFAEAVDKILVAFEQQQEEEATTQNTNQEYDRLEIQRQSMQQVADLMLGQAQRGSIAIFHMPERGFREATLVALEMFLEGLKARGWRCTTLTELHQICNNNNNNNEES